MAKTEPAVETEQVDVDALSKQLSKKNADYLFKFKRALKEENVSDEKQAEMLAEMLPEMLEAQHKGQPATQIYGPVSTKINQLLKRVYNYKCWIML